MSAYPHHEALGVTMMSKHDVLDDGWGADMEQLAQILQECHLHEAEIAGTEPQSNLSSPSPPGAIDTAFGAAGQWADELVNRLQNCATPQEGHALCAEALLAFHHKQGCASNLCPTAERLKKLQGANRVIVRALRGVSERQGGLRMRCQQAEEENAHLAEQLRQCQEKLRVSELAKSTLQSHLELMNSNLNESAHLSHSGGPPCR
jgi:hypothetical protein